MAPYLCYEKGKQLVALKHQGARMLDRISIPPPSVSGDSFPDQIDRAGVLQVETDHRFRGKVFGDARAAAIDRHRPGEKTVGDLFGPIKRIAEVFGREGIAVGSQGIPLVCDLDEPAAEVVQRQDALQALQESKAFPMPREHGLVAYYSGNVPALDAGLHLLQLRIGAGDMPVIGRLGPEIAASRQLGVLGENPVEDIASTVHLLVEIRRRFLHHQPEVARTAHHLEWSMYEVEDDTVVGRLCGVDQEAHVLPDTISGGRLPQECGGELRYQIYSYSHGLPNLKAFAKDVNRLAAAAILDRREITRGLSESTRVP